MVEMIKKRIGNLIIELWVRNIKQYRRKQIVEMIKKWIGSLIIELWVRNIITTEKMNILWKKLYD